MRDMSYNPYKKIVSLKASPIPLSEAILLGIGLRPQANGTWGAYNRRTRVFRTTCAILAACDAVGLLKRIEKAPGRLYRLGTTFPILEHQTTCPICPNLLGHLATVIVHLTDDHQWSREQVAYWVKTIEEGLRAAPISEAVLHEDARVHG